MAASPRKPNIRVEVDGDNKFFAKCHPMFERELRQLLKAIADTARTIVKERHERPPRHPGMRRPTGNMRRSIQPYAGRAAVIRRTGPEEITGTVTAGSSRAPYTRFVHEGTKRHTIRAKPGKYLSFIGAGRNGRKTFRTTRLEQFTDADFDALDLAGLPEEWNAAVRRSNRRLSDINAGRNSWLKRGDADVKIVEGRQRYADRRVVIDKVKHPGNKRSNFLNVAAHKEVTKRYGTGSFTQVGGGAPGRKIASRG